jgi:hypothetical protein
MDFEASRPRYDNIPSPPPAAQIMLIQEHHHHHHHPQLLPTTARRSNNRAPKPIFAGTKRKQSVNDFSRLASTQSNKPIGAAYTYNWIMWRSFGCSTCLRCAAGWFCLIFAIFGILFILWIFGILWICVFFDGFCEIRS